MTISFKYKEVKRPDGTKVKAPAIPVTLIGKTIFDVIAIIDSGADVTAISKSIADLLEIDLSAPAEKAHGIGGTIDVIPSKCSIRVEKGHEKYQFDIPIKVIVNESNLPVLLGRAGFFDNFEVTMNQKQNRISLKKLT